LRCENGHEFDKPLVLKGGQVTRIVCPICKGIPVPMNEPKIKYKITVEVEDE
jgi:hypothetical protein